MRAVAARRTAHSRPGKGPQWEARGDDQGIARIFAGVRHPHRRAGRRTACAWLAPDLVRHSPNRGSRALVTSPAFSELALPAALLEALSSLGYAAMLPVQARTLPAILAGRDVL